MGAIGDRRRVDGLADWHDPVEGQGDAEEYRGQKCEDLLGRADAVGVALDLDEGDALGFQDTEVGLFHVDARFLNSQKPNPFSPSGVAPVHDGDRDEVGVAVARARQIAGVVMQDDLRDCDLKLEDGL